MTCVLATVDDGSGGIDLRDYAKFAPTFWTGPTGKRIRARGRDAQVLACYLFTSPSSSMLGLYYLPLPTLCHEVGFLPDEARATLAALAELEFAFYDEEAELVWVVEAARYQIDEELKPADHRVKGIVRELESFGAHPYARAFYSRYKAAFSLPDITFRKGLPRPFKAPAEVAKPLRSQKKEQKQEQEKEQEQEHEQERSPAAAGAALPAEPVQPVAEEKPWSVEACDIWQRHMGAVGSMGGRIGKALKPLLQDHGWHTVRELWQRACEQAAAEPDPEYFTPEVFARTFLARQKAPRPPARASPTPRAIARLQQTNAEILGGLRGDGTIPGFDGRAVAGRLGGAEGEPAQLGPDPRTGGPPRKQLPAGARVPDE